MSNRGVDFTGKKIGMLTVLEKLPERSKKRDILWRCICDCGDECVVPTEYFSERHTSKHVLSCGCMANPLKDLTGMRFGRWTVLGQAPNQGKEYRTMWYCRCDCGNERTVSGSNLKSGKSVSCGCYAKEKTGNRSRVHGESNGRLHRIWTQMKQRCYNPHSEKFHIYGEEGKFVCDEWRNSYISFRNWAMANGYSDKLTIDRIDNTKGYSPDNCRWATNEEQSNNKRNNVHLSLDGVTMTVAQWSKKIGICYGTLQNRIRSGWTDEECLTTPVGQRRKKEVNQNEPESAKPAK